MTGLRIGEILALRWGRINLTTGALRVEETCYHGHFGTPKTKASRRELPLPPIVVQALLPVLKRMLSLIVDLEGPVHKNVAATRLAKAWELDRVGERMMHAIESTWRSLSREGLLKIQGSFLWPSVPTFQLADRQPSPSENESRRSIEEIPSEETALAMKNLVRGSLSIERDSLLLYVARIFGFERAGNQIQKALEDTLNELVETRQLVLPDGHVSLPN